MGNAAAAPEPPPQLPVSASPAVPVDSDGGRRPGDFLPPDRPRGPVRETLLRGQPGIDPVLDGWQIPLTQDSVGAHRLRHIPSMQSSQLFGSHRLWQAPFTQRWQGPQVSVQPWAVQV